MLDRLDLLERQNAWLKAGVAGLSVATLGLALIAIREKDPAQESQSTTSIEGWSLTRPESELRVVERASDGQDFSRNLGHSRAWRVIPRPAFSVGILNRTKGQMGRPVIAVVSSPRANPRLVEAEAEEQELELDEPGPEESSPNGPSPAATLNFSPDLTTDRSAPPRPATPPVEAGGSLSGRATASP